jgi:hypothetical protein
LEVVSPSLALIVVQDDEIRRRVVSGGGTPDEAKRLIAGVEKNLARLIQTSRQRFQVWSYNELAHVHSMAVGGWQRRRVTDRRTREYLH